MPDVVRQVGARLSGQVDPRLQKRFYSGPLANLRRSYAASIPSTRRSDDALFTFRPRAPHLGRQSPEFGVADNAAHCVRGRVKEALAFLDTRGPRIADGAMMRA